MMKILIVLCLASAVFAAKLQQAEKDIAKAKQALDQLTFSKEEHIYNVEGYVDQTEGGYENTVSDPCDDVSCRMGMECVVDPISRQPFCDCAQSCPLPETSDDAIHRTHVCATSNVTFTNLCEFHRRKCVDAELTGVHVDYYGECSEIPTCHASELADFPARMTQWFIESLSYLMERPEELGGLSGKEKVILQEPRRPEGEAIFWKFRRLDKNPADLYLDFAELEDLRAPIVLLEPCTKPFLAFCDVDQDSLISAIEFGRCLNLDDRDIEY